MLGTMTSSNSSVSGSAGSGGGGGAMKLSSVVVGSLLSEKVDQVAQLQAQFDVRKAEAENSPAQQHAKQVCTQCYIIYLLVQPFSSDPSIFNKFIRPLIYDCDVDNFKSCKCFLKPRTSVFAPVFDYCITAFLCIWVPKVKFDRMILQLLKNIDML